jgi:AcrR family transcriptional regulator
VHFYAHGFERASLDAIATDAGVSKMAVYSSFGSKEGLFEEVVRERTDRMLDGLADVDLLDPQQPRRALAHVGERFLMLIRGQEALGTLRSVYGAAGAKPEARYAFYRQGPERLTNELALYLRRAHAVGTLKVPNPRLAASLFLAMFLGDGHVRGLLMLDMPDACDDEALLREDLRVFLAAYAAGQ